VSHRKYGRLFLLRKPFKFFVFASQTLQVFRLALRKKAQYVVVLVIMAQSREEHKYFQNDLVKKKRQKMKDAIYVPQQE
jgi:hypothetical protein